MVLCALTSHLAAQPPRHDAAAVATILAGNRPVDVAWATHYATELGGKPMIQELLRTLAKWRNDPTEEARLVCAYTLEALLQLEVTVPAGELTPWLDDEASGMAAFVLLVREPQHNEADLFTIFRRDWPAFAPDDLTRQNLRTLAIGNVLAAQGTPGFAAILVEGLDLDLRIRVIDADVAPSPAAPAPGTGDAPTVRPPAGWPAPMALRLHPPGTSSDGLVVRTPGTMQLRVTRPARAHSLEQLPIAAGHVEPTQALRWLGHMTNLAIPSASRRLTLADPQAFVDYVVRARHQQQVFLDALRRTLVDRRAMTEEQARPLERRITVHLTDARRQRATPLPPIPAP